MLSFGILLAGNMTDGFQSVGQLILKFMTFLTLSHLTGNPTFVFLMLLAFADVSNAPAEYRAEKTKAVLGTVQSMLCVAVELRVVSCSLMCD
jgi:hypothetical protein